MSRRQPAKSNKASQKPEDQAPNGALSQGQGSLVSPNGATDPLADALSFLSGPEPAATERALRDSSEGEHLYRDIKNMEFEAMQHPDPEDTIVQTPLADIEAEIDPADVLGIIDV